MTDQIGITYKIDLAPLKRSARAAKREINKFSKWVEKSTQPKTSPIGDTKKIDSAAAGLKRLGVESRHTMADIKKLNLSALDTQRVFEMSKKRMADLSKQVSGGGRSAGAASREFARLQSRMPALEYEVQKGKKAFGDYRRAMDRWGQGFKYMMASQLAWIASGAVLFAVLGSITQALKDIITYHQQFKALQAITQANASEMLIMEKAIRAAAVGTKFFAADMADAATIMGQAGFTAKEVASSIGAVAVLASATGRGLKDVASLVTSVIRAYGLHASEALRVANVLAAGISSSRLQVEDLTAAMNYMGVAAHQFNMSVEDSVAWLGLLRDRGLRASTVGTSFRGVLATLTKETDKFTKVLKRLPEPLGFADITIRRGRRLEDSMARLAKAGFGIADAFAALPRRTAMTFSLMVKNTEVFKKLRSAITGTNRAIEMNRIMMQGSQSQLAQTKSIFDEFVVSLTKSGGSLEPLVKTFKTIVQLVTSGVIVLSTFFDIAAKGIAGIAAGVSLLDIGKIHFKHIGKFALPVIDFEKTNFDEVFSKEALEALKGFEFDLVKTMENAAESIRNIIGKDGLFGENVFLPQGEQERQKVENTIVQLINRKAELVEAIRKIPEGTAEWKDMRGEIALVTAMIKELEEKAGLAAAPTGPVATLEDVLTDMALNASTSIDELLGVFRRGTQDIKTVEEAVARMRKTFQESFEAWKLSLGEEEYVRMIKLAKELVAAETKLASMRKKAKAGIKTKKAHPGLYPKSEVPLYDPGDISGGVKEEIGDITVELGDHQTEWKKMTRGTAQSMEDSMTNIFFDSMTGQLKSAKEYWKSFTNSILRYIAEMTARWLLLQAIGGGSAMFGMFAGAGAGGGAGTAGVTGGTAGGAGTMMAHLGGLQKMHSGGASRLNSNEFVRILKDNEYVIRDSSAKRIGTQALDRINATGQMPQQAPVIHEHKNYWYVDAIDPASFDAVLRDRGSNAINDISLNAFSRARMRRDSRVK
jgi:TP901 family phage tail tape measure protein